VGAKVNKVTLVSLGYPGPLSVTVFNKNSTLKERKK